MHANISGIVSVRGDAFVIGAAEVVRWKVSEFIGYAAWCIHEGEPIEVARELRPAGWEKYVVLTQPEKGWPVDDIESTRVIRFLLAAAIAESEGN